LTATQSSAAGSAAGGLAADQVQLVLSAVDQDDPGPPAGRVAGFGLAEGGGDDLGRVEFHRSGQPFRLRPGPGAERAVTVAPAGLGDHVVRAARGWLGVVDTGQGSHPLAVRFLPGRQPGPHLALAAGGPGGRRAQRSGPHHDPLGIGGKYQQRRGGARHRDAGGVERGDVGGGAHHGLLELPFAHHRSAAAGEGRVRGLERAAGGFHRGRRARAWERRQAGSDKAASAG
jgi:hypothetical protein